MNVKVAMKSILIVEDNEQMQRIYRHLFKSRPDKYDIEIQGDARRAFLRLKQKHFDMVILDMLMEPMGGEEFFSCVRADEDVWDMPILVVTILNPDRFEHFKQINGIRFLQKPVTAEQLFEQMDDMLL